MKTRITLLASVLFAVTVATAISSFTPPKKFSIDGAWAIVEVQTVRPDGTSTSTFPKEGQALFANNFYSLCWTSHAATGRSWQIADSEKLNRFNQSIINTGTFELKDAILTTRATFAMSPMFTGGVATFKCSFRGDTLLLTGLNVVSSDNVVHPVYSSGSHFVNKLVRVRKK